MSNQVKRVLGGSAEASPPREELLDDLAQYVWEMSGHLWRGASEGRVPDAVPPLSLETSLNGGPNPSVARHYVDRLTHPALPPDARILDMGCGYGRIALELATRLSRNQRYTGLDPHEEAIDWASASITSRYPNVSFVHVDIANAAYNTDGALHAPAYRFPFEDESLDLILMISVMTHVDVDTVQTYVRESARTLKPTGRLAATFFLLDETVDDLLATGRSAFDMRWAHGPSRVENPDNPELAIAHPRDLVLEILSDAGFSEPAVVDGNWCGRTSTDPMDFQDLVIANRSGATVLPTPEPERLDLDATEARPFVDAAAELADLGLITPQVAADFLTWAGPVVLNVLWWHDRGLTLASAHAGRVEPFAWSFAQCRSLGFDLRSPTDATGPAAFTPLDPDDILHLLVGAAALATRREIVDCVREIARCGALIHRAALEGRDLVLLSPGAPTQPAPIPVAEHLALADAVSEDRTQPTPSGG